MKILEIMPENEDFFGGSQKVCTVEKQMLCETWIPAHWVNAALIVEKAPST
jgi:hypothetical protein